MDVNDSIVEHIPVLAERLVEQINLSTDAMMVDTTIGHGGHSFLFAQKLGSKGGIIGLDVDEDALKKAENTLKDVSCKVIFAQFAERLLEWLLGSLIIAPIAALAIGFIIFFAARALLRKKVTYEREKTVTEN